MACVRNGSGSNNKAGGRRRKLAACGENMAIMAWRLTGNDKRQLWQAATCVLS